MLTIRDSGATLCDHLTRRDWLRIGALGALGLSLPTLWKERVSPDPGLVQPRLTKRR